MKKLSIRSIMVALIAIVGVVAIMYYNSPKNKTAGQPSMASIPVVVESTKAQQEVWQRQIHVTGSLESFQGVTIKSPLVQGGIVSKIYFTSGQEVKKGDPLFSMHPANTTIYAAFSGKVGLKQVDVGDLVTAGTPLVTLQQIDPLKVQFTIPQSYLSYLDLEQAVDVSTTAYPGVAFKGKVFAIDNHLDEDTRSIRVWAELPNQQRKLYPGLFVDVLLHSDDKLDVVSVPQAALVYSQTATYLYKIEDNKAVRQDVVVGIRQGDRIQIAEGLKAGDSIVLAGQIKVMNGSTLMVKNDKSQAKLDS